VAPRRPLRGAGARGRAALRRAAQALSPLAKPPDDLTGFPFYILGRGERLYRIHRRERSPWWFSDDGSGRFDLAGDARGTCYLAAGAVGAFIEVFRTETVIPEAEVAARRLATLSAPKRTTLADCTVTRARRFGITAAIHTQPSYERTRAWAEAFAGSGFGGIRYRLGHDPAQRELGVALFGAAGEQDLPVRETGPIGADVVEEARRRFGLIVAPTPV
jgi:RES domain-containing protein